MIGNTIYRVDEPNCPYAADDDVLRQYVAGKLPEAAAEDFEEHLFQCDRCRDEVQTAIELRAAWEKQAATRQEGRWGVRRYSVMAVAAAATIVVVGLWQARSRQELQPPPLRSANAREISASGQMAGGTFTLTWTPVSGAHSYRVQVLNAVGEPVTSTETTATMFSVALPPIAPGEPLYWKVQALDDDRVVIAASKLHKIGRP